MAGLETAPCELYCGCCVFDEIEAFPLPCLVAVLRLEDEGLEEKLAAELTPYLSRP